MNHGCSAVHWKGTNSLRLFPFCCSLNWNCFIPILFRTFISLVAFLEGFGWPLGTWAETSWGGKAAVLRMWVQLKAASVPVRVTLQERKVGCVLPLGCCSTLVWALRAEGRAWELPKGVDEDGRRSARGIKSKASCAPSSRKCWGTCGAWGWCPGSTLLWAPEGAVCLWGGWALSLAFDTEVTVLAVLGGAAGSQVVQGWHLLRAATGAAALWDVLSVFLLLASCQGGGFCFCLDKAEPGNITPLAGGGYLYLLWGQSYKLLWES